MASTGKRVFLSSGAPLTLPGMTSTKGQSDQSKVAMLVPSFHRSLLAGSVLMRQRGRGAVIKQDEASSAGPISTAARRRDTLAVESAAHVADKTGFFWAEAVPPSRDAAEDIFEAVKYSSASMI